MKSSGVNITGLIIKSHAFTPMVIAMVEPDGERMLVVYPPHGGAHTQLEKSDVKSEWLKSATWLHTTGMCLRESPTNQTIISVMEQAHTHKIPVSLDLNARLELWSMDSPTRQIFDRAIELSDIVFGSATEEIIHYTSESNLEIAARKLCAGKRIIVARQGADGATAFTPDKVIHSPAYRATPLDTTGAGDAFDAGFIASYSIKPDLEKALHWGNSYAGLQIQGLGARSFPDVEDFEAIIYAD